MNKINSRKKLSDNHFVLVWHKGGYINGSEWRIARKYSKAKRLILGLVKIEGRNQFVYSLKVNGRWLPQGTIDDTGDYDNNRKAAYKDFFNNTLIKQQDDFSIFPLKR